MNFSENSKEAWRSVRSNMLRSSLTALIIMIGISTLIGILTAIDAIRYSVEGSLASLGSNSFEINEKMAQGRRRNSGSGRIFPILTYRQIQTFASIFANQSLMSVSTAVSFTAQAKSETKQTNPNCGVRGIDQNYLELKGYSLSSGRNFTSFEFEQGNPVCLIGPEIQLQLFGTTNAVGQKIRVLGSSFTIAGVLVSSSSMMGGSGTDRAILIPLKLARQFSANRLLSYQLIVFVKNPADFEHAMGQATGLMRQIRHDKAGNPDSFEINRSETLASSLNQITGYLQAAGFGIGLITLLGAAIGLMNIMMVSVTERTREIGVRKSLGATARHIQQQFLTESVMICLAGGAGGVILGMIMGNGVMVALGENKFIVPWLWISFGIGLCVLVGLISGWYPAKKAAALDPIEALRYE